MHKRNNQSTLFDFLKTKNKNHDSIVESGLTALVPTASTAIEVDSLPVCPIHPVLITFTGINN